MLYEVITDMAIGNVIGSGIFNIFLILGSCAIISPISFSISYNTDLCLLIVGARITSYNVCYTKLLRISIGKPLINEVLYNDFLYAKNEHNILIIILGITKRNKNL